MKISLLLFVLLYSFFCIGSPALEPKAHDEISIMSFNVENLFDTKKDLNRDDHAYLPLKNKKTVETQNFCKKLKKNYKKECLELDWNEDTLTKKMQNLAHVILSPDQGKGPDILLLVEVENKPVLEKLNREYLKKSDYKTLVLIEGPDKRGIDVALLSRLPELEPAKLHKIPYKGRNPEEHSWMKRSRGILEARLQLPSGDALHVFVGHFPSQRNPTYWREQSVHFIKEKMKSLGSRMFILGGDLNITTEEEAKTGFFSQHLSSVGIVLHLHGCKNCLGTYNYKGAWSFLDTLIVSKNMSADKGNAPYFINLESADVLNSSPTF